MRTVLEGLRPGTYRYLALTHELLLLPDPHAGSDPPAGSEACGRVRMRDVPAAACFEERFAADAPVCYVWSCIPCRGEWRYGSKSHKAMPVDAGHICQNLYLTAGSIGCGACAVAGYDQDRIDAMLGLDGVDEYVVYLAPVGKVGGTNPFSLRKRVCNGSSLYEWEIVHREGVEGERSIEIGAAPLIRGVVADVTAGVPVGSIATRFHHSVARLVAQVCQTLRDESGLNEVALSGGVWQNVTLLSATLAALEEAGFTVYTHRLVPPNDGGLALGQAAVAHWRVDQDPRP
jgi:SagB-type dehydrogenase family enzyme